MERRHLPVLQEEVMSLLRCGPHQTFVDATLGGGGHAQEILRRTGPDGILIGIEWDEEAIGVAQEVLRSFGDRVKIFRENFIRLPEILGGLKVAEVDGILLDLGLSSLQLEEGTRGFSLKKDGPLDMRMDRRLGRTAADLVNTLSQGELEEVFFEYGEEWKAKQVARAIVEERRRGPIETTAALRRTVLRGMRRPFRSGRIDPATRIFQALRICVNDELGNLRQVLESGWRFLRTEGRLCVISFHSLEDRIVKETFRTLATGEGTEGSPGPSLRLVTQKPVRPSDAERERNPRSRSAKLRCAERGGGPDGGEEAWEKDGPRPLDRGKGQDEETLG